MTQTFTSDIINLNVGGTKFSTSRQTLCSIQDSFFSSLLSGRIPSCRDEHGYVFIDRDPKYFSIILNFLRTKELNINGVDDIAVLRSEAEFYAITPLVKRLLLCEDLDRSLCGDVLFTGFVPAPHIIAKTANLAHLSKPSMMMLDPSSIVTNSSTSSTTSSTSSSGQTLKPGNVLRLFPNPKPSSSSTLSDSLSSHSRASSIDLQPTLTSTLAAAAATAAQQQQQNRLISHSRKSSNEFLASHLLSSTAGLAGGGGGGCGSGSSGHVKCHSRNQSLELKQMKTDLGILLTDVGGGLHTNRDVGGVGTANNQTINGNLQVNLIVGHHNWISVAYAHYVCCYKLKDGMGWQLMFQSNYIEEEIERLAFNSKHQLSSSSNLLNSSNAVNLSNNPLVGSNSSNNSSSSSLSTASNVNSNVPLNLSGLVLQQQSQQQSQQQNPPQQSSQLPILNTPTNQSIQASFSSSTSPTQTQTDQNSKLCALIAISFKNIVRLWLVTDETSTHLIGQFSLGTCAVDQLFFIGSQLVATSLVGKIGVWNSLSQLWQTQEITPISAFDTAGSVLLLGGQNGLLYYIDMQKFPLRMKDNDLLVTQLYKDPCGDPITALSVYLTPKTSNTGNWIEIAYGTSTGQVRVIVQHPETVGHGPQLFQSFSVHRGSVIKVMLTEKHLVSVCSEFNHVRTWNVTRFRGMISTQPGSTPLASFKIVTIDAVDAPISYSAGNDIGPFGDRDNYQVFIQKCVPYTDQLFVRLSSTGKRLCTIKSIDYSTITSFCVHECEGPSRLNSRPRRYLFTGHSNGTIQVWDLTTALELKLTSGNSNTPTANTSATIDPQQQQQQNQLREINNHLGGPTPGEFVKLLDRIELASTTSGYSTPTTTNCLSPCMSVGGGSSAGATSNNNGNSNKYLNKSLLINSAANSNQQHGGGVSGFQHGPIMHHQNQLTDDEKNVSTTKTSNE